MPRDSLRVATLRRCLLYALRYMSPPHAVAARYQPYVAVMVVSCARYYGVMSRFICARYT